MTTTHHATQHVTIPMQVDRDELLNNIMGSAWETWSWWQTLRYADGCDWDTYPTDPTAPYVTLGVDDPDMGEGEGVRTVTLSVDDIVTATAKVLSTYRHIRWDDMDACDGDCILQHATLGEVVYG